MKFYNQKVIRTGPYVEIWTYSKPIITHSDEVTISNETLNEKKHRRDFEDLSSEEQKDRLLRMKNNRLQAKWRLLRIIDCNYNDRTSFLTLTTKENIRDRATFLDMLKTFIKRFNGRLQI